MWRPVPIMVLAWLLGVGPSGAAAQQGTLIVLNKSDATVSLLDPLSGEALATVPVGGGPHEVAVSPDGKRAVVTNYGGVRAGNTLTVLDLAARRVLRTIELGPHRRPHGIEWLDGERIAVTAEASRALLLVDVATGGLTDAIDTGQDVSHMVAVVPRLRRAFVTNIGSGSVTVIDLARRERVANVPTGAGAEGVAVSPDGREVWVTNRSADTVSVLDAETLAILATIPVREFPIRAKFTPDGRHVLVSNARSGDVAVLDAAGRREVRRISLAARPDELKNGRQLGRLFGSSPAPVGILVVPGHQRAYVANTNADLVSVIDLSTWQVVGRLVAGREPDGLGYAP